MTVDAVTNDHVIAHVYLDVGGSYTAIDPAVHRFLSGGVGHDILGVEHDSQGATTRLHLREVLH